jgi:hypothetical protein
MRTTRQSVAIRVLTACLLAVSTSGVTHAVPAPPTLNPPLVTGSTVNLSWNVALGVSGIRLEAGTAPGLSNAANALFGAIGAYTATDVPPGVYYVRVRAVDGTGESAPSNEVTVIVGGVGPPAPGCTAAPNPPTLNPPTTVGNTVTFSWLPAAGGCPATGYSLHAGSGPGLSNLAVVNTGAVTTFSASAPNGTYYVRVFGQNPFGSSAPSMERTAVVSVVVPPPTPPPTPLPPPPPSGGFRVGARCRDGWISSSTGSGTCSSHGGVACWLYNDGSCRAS